MIPPRTLGDVSIDRRWLDLQCATCLHEVHKPAWEIEGWPDSTLAEFQKRARCSECRSSQMRIKELIWCKEMLPKEGTKHADSE